MNEERENFVSLLSYPPRAKQGKLTEKIYDQCIHTMKPRDKKDFERLDEKTAGKLPACTTVTNHHHILLEGDSSLRIPNLVDAHQH